MDTVHHAIIVWTESDPLGDVRHVVVNRIEKSEFLTTPQPVADLLNGDQKGYMSISPETYFSITNNGMLDTGVIDEDTHELIEVSLELSQSDLLHLYRWLDANQYLFSEVLK